VIHGSAQRLDLALGDDARDGLDDTDSDEVLAEGPVALGVKAPADVAAADTDEGGVLSASFAFPTGAVSADTVERLAGLWSDALSALATYAEAPGSGGLTPSDVPLVRQNSTI